MDLGRVFAKYLKFLHWQSPQSINCGKLWKTAVDAVSHIMVVGSDWVCEKRVNSGTHLFKKNESMYTFIQCVINCFTAQYQLKDMPKGYLDVQVAH